MARKKGEWSNQPSPSSLRKRSTPHGAQLCTCAVAGAMKEDFKDKATP